MKYVGLICYLLILRVNSMRSNYMSLPNIIPLNVNLDLHFDVDNLRAYPRDLIDVFIASMLKDVNIYFRHSALTTSLNINATKMIVHRKPIQKSMNIKEYLMKYCIKVQNKQQKLTILFIDPVANMREQQKVFTEKGSYCDTSRSCAIIVFQNWPENAFNLARAIASSVGVGFDEGFCAEGHTVMKLLYENPSISLPYMWSKCSRYDLESFLKSSKSNCLKPLREPEISENNKLKIKLDIHFDNSYDAFYINWNNLKNQVKNEIEEYFTYDKLNSPIELDIKLSKDIKSNNMSNNGLQTLRNYCNMIKSQDNSNHFSVLISSEDLYVLDSRGKKNYDNVFYSEKGNHCDKTTNCAVIEHSLWKDDVFNLVRVIAHSLGISFDGTENKSCNEDNTIMSITYDGNNIPTKWSECSRNDFDKFMRSNQSYCLKNEPKIETTTTKQWSIPSPTRSPQPFPKPPLVTDHNVLGPYELDLEFHFIQNQFFEKDLKVLRKKSQLVIKNVENLLRRPQLHIEVKLNLVDVKLINAKTAMNSLIFKPYCNKQTHRKSKKALYTVLMIKDIHAAHMNNMPWDKGLLSNPKSICDNKKNCAIMFWKDVTLSAFTLTRVLGISLGAPIDGKDNNCTDESIMSVYDRFIYKHSNWSLLSREGVHNYLNSMRSSCLKGKQNNYDIENKENSGNTNVYNINLEGTIKVNSKHKSMA